MPLLLSGNKSPPAPLHQRTLNLCSTRRRRASGLHLYHTALFNLTRWELGTRSTKPVADTAARTDRRKANYMSHRVKDDNGRTTCPVLRSYSCKLCGATQDEAHTETRCPLYVPEDHDTSIATLKATRYGAGELQ